MAPSPEDCGEEGSSPVGLNVEGDNFVRRLDIVPFPEIVAEPEAVTKCPVGVRIRGERVWGEADPGSSAVIPRKWLDLRDGRGGDVEVTVIVVAAVPSCDGYLGAVGPDVVLFVGDVG